MKLTNARVVALIFSIIQIIRSQKTIQNYLESRQNELNREQEPQHRLRGW